MTPRDVGLLLVGHGTRSERGRAEFLETAGLLRQWLPGTPIAPCFLELAEPTIDEGLALLVAQGCRRVVVMPLLLFAAGHAKDDIPRAVANAARAQRGLEVTFAEHLGCHQRLLRLSAQRFEETLRVAREVAARDTLWLMVGRGSRDADALAEMERFVQERLVWTPVGHVRVAYLAMAQPSLATILPQIADWRLPRVVVQPHLLFHGDLLDTVERQVGEIAAAWPDQQWLVAPQLGVADLLVEAIAERFWEHLTLVGT
jgi:sirohydrochlorin cobaltochelatase